jgi:hypothetical protein
VLKGELAVVTMEGVEVPALLIEDNGDIVLVLYDTGLDKVLKVELAVVTMELWSPWKV